MSDSITLDKITTLEETVAALAAQVDDLRDTVAALTHLCAANFAALEQPPATVDPDPICFECGFLKSDHDPESNEFVPAPSLVLEPTKYAGVYEIFGAAEPAIEEMCWKCAHPLWCHDEGGECMAVDCPCLSFSEQRDEPTEQPDPVCDEKRTRPRTDITDDIERLWPQLEAGVKYLGRKSEFVPTEQPALDPVLVKLRENVRLILVERNGATIDGIVDEIMAAIGAGQSS